MILVFALLGECLMMVSLLCVVQLHQTLGVSWNYLLFIDLQFNLA